MALLGTPFETVVSRLEGAVMVSIRGELDTFTAARLRNQLHDLINNQGNLRVVVDLERTTFIDSSGLALLVEALRWIRSRGGELTLASPARNVRRALEISGLNRVFTVTAAAAA